MEAGEVLQAILEQKVIAIVRLDSAARAVAVVETIHDAGIRCVEVSLTTPGALRAITEVRERLPGVRIGAGTVCTRRDADDALAAGASFLVTPITATELVDVAHAKDAPIVLGAFTPTEIHGAHAAGADLVKLFPASAVTPEYLRAVRAPLPDVRLVPTGGVDARNALDWLRRGAVAVGVGGSLTDPAVVATGDLAPLARAARHLLQTIGTSAFPQTQPTREDG